MISVIYGDKTAVVFGAVYPLFDASGCIVATNTTNSFVSSFRIWNKL